MRRMFRSWVAAGSAALAAAAAAQEPGAAGGHPAAAAPVLSNLERVQSRLARQREAVETLLLVAEGLDAAAEYDAAGILLAEGGDSADGLREALRVAREAKRRPVAVPAGTARAAAPASGAPGEGIPEPAGGAPAEPQQPSPRPPLEVGSGDVLYAQAGDGERGVPAKVVLRIGTKQYSLPAGATAAAGRDRVSLVGVADGPGGGLLVELDVNGRAVALPYGAVR